MADKALQYKTGSLCKQNAQVRNRLICIFIKHAETTGSAATSQMSEVTLVCQNIVSFNKTHKIGKQSGQ